MNIPPADDRSVILGSERSPADRVRAVLLEHLPGYEPGTLSSLVGTTGEWVVEVDGSLIVTLPGVEASATTGLPPSVEAALIRSLGGLLDVPVPIPVLQDDPHWVRAHRKLPGRALADLPELEAAHSIRLGRRLGGVLADLHGVDASDTGANLPIAGGPESYRAAAERAWAARTESDQDLTAPVTEFLQRPAPDHPPHPSLCHLALHPAAILLDENDRLSGIQHWENAGIGDPARDLAAVLSYLGTAPMDAALDGYRRAGAVIDDDPDLLARIMFHARCAALMDLDRTVAESLFR